jgi:hypothetical protein
MDGDEGRSLCQKRGEAAGRARREHREHRRQKRHSGERNRAYLSGAFMLAVVQLARFGVVLEMKAVIEAGEPPTSGRGQRLSGLGVGESWGGGRGGVLLFERAAWNWVGLGDRG